jgi:uncharacterized protein (TIGR04255 family)
VIEIKFKESLDPTELEKASGKFISDYPQHQHVQTFNVNLELPEDQPDAPKAKFDRVVGHRRSSVDMTELLLFFRSAFVISQLAPYPGWDSFLNRFSRDWAVWKRFIGFREITRIGVRYINRIDIPISGSVVEFEAYLNVFPKLPDVFPPVNAYAVQAVLPMEDIRCKLTLNSAAVPSPILDHASFVFDQDIAREIDPPQRDEAIYELLNEIRIQKNKIFEACITNRARELFSK